MRINVYEEELTEDRTVEKVSAFVNEGQHVKKFIGIRIYLESTNKLHDVEGDDDRSAITFWGDREKVAAMLRLAADEMEK